jgi:hypothetical protein
LGGAIGCLVILLPVGAAAAAFFLFAAPTGVVPAS